MYLPNVRTTYIIWVSVYLYAITKLLYFILLLCVLVSSDRQTRSSRIVGSDITKSDFDRSYSVYNIRAEGVMQYNKL